MPNSQDTMLKDVLIQLESRTNFLEELNKITYKIKTGYDIETSTTASNEALILCLCYIDSCGSIHYGNASKNNFLKVLINFGDNPILSAIHPKILIESFKKKLKKSSPKRHLSSLFEKIKPHLDTKDHYFYTSKELLDLLVAKTNSLSVEEKKLLSEELIYGSYAAFVYDMMRSIAVHNGMTGTWSFSNLNFNGNSVDNLTFEFLFKTLKNIISNLKSHYQI